MGKWLEANGEAIYGPLLLKPYSDGKVAYTPGATSRLCHLHACKRRAEAPAHIMVRTTLTGKLKVALLASKQELTYTQYETSSWCRYPKPQDVSAQQEAVVIKVAL